MTTFGSGHKYLSFPKNSVWGYLYKSLKKGIKGFEREWHCNKMFVKAYKMNSKGLIPRYRTRLFGACVANYQTLTEQRFSDHLAGFYKHLVAVPTWVSAVISVDTLL